jgi:quinolinate synthase
MLAPTELPPLFAQMAPTDAHDFIRGVKAKMKQDLLILGHHYQRHEVIEHADATGDSLKLAKIAATSHQKHIVFCGVHFMAESADILTDGKRDVCLPDLGAGCDMADMAELRDVKVAWQEAVQAGAKKIIPVTYINSSAALKAFVGEHGGIICTSSNAKKVLEWAIQKEGADHVFFFPDQHLGRNIAKGMGYKVDGDMILWDPKEPWGGHDSKDLKNAKIWLWKGHCPVHALFTVHQIKKIRAESPETKILVHPECSMEIVDLSDLNGSTDFIIKTIEAAPSGSRWAVGTEKNLVDRLAMRFPEKHITSLNPYSCLCGTMNRISLQHLAWSLDGLVNHGKLPNIIRVPEAMSHSAKLALDRMMAVSQ